MIQTLTVSTTPYPVFLSNGTQQICFIIQNLSPNDIYFIEEPSQNTTEGIKISSGASLSKDFWKRNIYLIATAAGSEVRVCYQSGMISTTNGGGPTISGCGR